MIHQDVIKLIIHYTHPPALINLFKTHQIDFNLKFTYNHYINKEYINIFPNIIITTIRSNHFDDAITPHTKSLVINDLLYRISPTHLQQYQLQHIKIYSCPCLKDISSLKFLPNLKTIILNDCSDLTIIPDLSECINLRVFVMCGTDKLTQITVP